MKKILFILIFCLFINLGAEARDYVNLHLKEMKHAKKYGVTNQYFKDYSEDEKENVQEECNIKLKDPKLIKLGGYDNETLSKYNEKIKKDNIEYQKIKEYLANKKIDDFNSQAYPEDFYKIYRIAEKIIRANNLDYINWRIIIDTDRNFNANSSELNCLVFNTGLIDTFKGNDDALALIVAHEISHSMLGHGERLNFIYNQMLKAKRDGSPTFYAYYKRKYLIDSKNSEYAADVEGAKLITKAQFNLENAKEALSVINTMDYKIEFDSEHPSGENRLKNYEQNIKYFMSDEWIKQGKYNIINSEVLNCKKSSDRKAIIIVRNKLKDTDKYYRPESIEDIYKRIAYYSYLDKDMKKSQKYFKKWSKKDKNNIIPYIYLSYIEEYKYKTDKKDKYLINAEKYIEKAKLIDDKNKYVNNQIKELKGLKNNTDL